MTDPISLARSQLEELVTLQPEYEQYAELLSLRGHGFDLAAVTSLTGSPVENTVIRLEAQRAPLDALTDVAVAWGYTHGNILRWMINHIDNAHPTTSDFETITWAHARVTRLLDKPTPGPLCPLNTNHTTTTTDTGYTCIECDTTRTTEEHRALTNWQLRQANPLVTAHQAATLLNTDPGTIRQRIHRRAMTPTHEKLYRIQDLM